MYPDRRWGFFGVRLIFCFVGGLNQPIRLAIADFYPLLFILLISE